MERLDKADSPAALAEQALRERDVIALVAALVRELHPQRIRFIDVRLSSRIERDLGIDSLGRTELILRIERAFRVRLPAQTIGEAETVHDLVRALEQAGPALRRTALETPSGPALPSVPAARTHELFRDGWLDSGDRAYMAEGDVCITGRVKDI